VFEHPADCRQFVSATALASVVMTADESGVHIVERRFRSIGAATA
jgi:hypothetical protein